ncbi:MAG: tetratricopeptide repeat protein, partial [Candidatus Sericytochromatia bacterium]
QPAALYDYLAQEVFSHQDASTQDFLLVTSLLPQVDAGSCREALGLEGAGDRLRQLIQGNMLLPEGPEGRGPDTYAYHPSFRRFLMARLEETKPPEAIAALCGRIAAYLAKSQPEEALGFWLRAGDLESASAHLARLAPALVANNQVERLRAMIDRFPAAYRQGSYPLSFYQGEVERLWGNFDLADGLFARANELALAPGLRGRALVHRSAIAMTRGDAKAGEMLAAGEALLEDDDLESRSFASNLRGAAALATNQSDEALACYEAALAGYRQCEDAVGQAKVLNNLGLCYTRFGRFEEAIATYQEAVAQSEKAGRYPHPMILNNMASILCYQGEFQLAWQAAERALDLAQLLKMRRDELYAHLCLGSANVGLGDFRRAEHHYEACRDGARSLKDRVVGAKAYAALSELAHLQGETPRAVAILDQGIALLGLPIDDPRQGDQAILLGLLKLETGAFDEAEALLSRLETEYHALGFRYREAQVAFYRARLAARRGEGAQEAFAAAEAIATAHGYRYLLEQERRHCQAAPEAPAAVPARTAVAPAIQIQCFGSLQVTVGDRLVPNRDWRGFKTKLILAYLLAHPEGVTKEQLTELLYAEMDTTRTATLVLISRLRHALEPELSRETPSR